MLEARLLSYHGDRRSPLPEELGVDAIRPSNSSIAERIPQLEMMGIPLGPYGESALVLLLNALEKAEDLQCSVWDFAVELFCIRRLNVTRSDLRWLVAKGYVESAIEVTLPGDAVRSFRRPPRLLFSKRCCLVLTPSGADFARKVCGQRLPTCGAGSFGMTQPSRLALSVTPKVLVPKWDRDRQELRMGAILIKQFKVPAVNQEIVLAAFEEEDWPPRIDDPLPPHQEQSSKRRLQETIKSLNRNQKRAVIRFLGDGSGQGVRWELSSDIVGVRRTDPDMLPTKIVEEVGVRLG